MAAEKLTLKNFIKKETLLEKKRKKKKKSKTTKKKGGGIASAWYNDGLNAADSSGGDAGGMGESFILELLAGITPSSFSANINSATAWSKNSNDQDAGMTTYPSEDPDAREEEPEMKVNKVDQARQLFQAMFNQPNATRADIINSFMKDIGVTNSTAVSYYTRFLDEFGLSSKDAEENLGQGVSMGGGMDAPSGQADGDETLSQAPEEDPEMEDPIDPNRAGIIRTVDNAHLVYKRQQEDGMYEELWIYNLHDSVHDELDIRRDILAGTDIPPKKTRSPDGAQKYTINTLGNAQLMHLTGLSN